MVYGTFPVPRSVVRTWLFLLLLSWGARVLAAQPPVASFTENKGQWPTPVLYRTLIPGGALFVERNTLTYSLHRGGPVAHHGHDAAEAVEPFRAHAYRVHFEGASPAQGLGLQALPHYENFFLGSDPAHWGTRCSVFGEVRLEGLYPGIALRIDGANGLKYDLLVAPGADPAAIDMRFEGPDGLELRDGRLVVHTSAGDVVEEAPVAYQETATGRRAVPCHYRLHEGHVTFALPKGYDRSLPLVIDPVLSFSTYSGSAGDNFGFTASYDDAGHLYGGGIVFSTGYPITSGVLGPGFQGGDIDIGITKFAVDGASLVWSTYIGGNGSESPHSLVVNSNEEVYLLGSSGSSDFPTTPGCFDASFNGGTSVSTFDPGGGWVGLSGGYGYGHANGTDIVVAHFSADASSLIGATYIGGTKNDGLNNVLPLCYNYGDAFRGEIALDPQERPVVVTSTESNDIPVSSGAPQTAFGGGQQDAYLCRLDPALTMLQSTFYGGSGNDSGYGVQFDSTGQIFITGGSNSTDLPMAGTPYRATTNGDVDGYIARFSANGTTLLSTTYLGTPAYDQSYFVQLNTADEVFVVGQTHGTYPISQGKYGTPGSSQFIHKFSHDLSISLWSTAIGSGAAMQDVSPSAFLVSDCGQIYFSGWGGAVNHNGQADLSTTTGLPVTSNAFQPTTTGSDFYLMVLEREATALNYATFFGGQFSAEHVDGGTSRFDKKGNVYQAVCAGCGSSDNFPTTPGAWSTTNGSNNCNLGVFKFNLTLAQAEVQIDGDGTFCLPATVQFTNASNGGNTYQWSFGDGGTSTAFAPSHVYTGAGVFPVTLILTDSTGCTIGDTATIAVTVVDPSDASIDPVPALCTGQQVQLHAHGGGSYLWSPPDHLDDPAIADPTITAVEDVTYTVVVTDVCGTDTATIAVDVGVPVGGAGPDTTVCIGHSVPLSGEGGGTYHWSPPGSLDNPTAAAPLATPQDTTWYVVTVTTPEGCTLVDSMLVVVQFSVPDPALTDTAICLGGQVRIVANDGDRYSWRPAEGITELHVPDPVVAPPAPMYYAVAVSNACGTTWDSVFVDVQQVIAAAWPDTIICPGSTVWLHAEGGTTYDWSPSAAMDGQGQADVLVHPGADTWFQVVVYNALGCADTAFAHVDLFPAPTVSAGTDLTVEYGHSTQLQAFGEGDIIWVADPTLSCDSCAAPLASPLTSTTYTVQLTDANGCKAADQVIVYVNGSLFVPNTFTPNGDGINDAFFARATEVKEFRLFVFDRWGQKIYDSDQLTKAWDGTYHGVESPIDTYVWRVDLTELNGDRHTTYGHVNLLR